jgi:hypothetical protein
LLKSKSLIIVAGDTLPPKKVAPVIYTGLDECTQDNVAKCIAK